MTDFDDCKFRDDSDDTDYSQIIASKIKLGAVGSALFCNEDKRGTRLFHLYRSRKGWAIISSTKPTLKKKRVVDDEVLIDYDLGGQICSIYEDEDQVPAKDWLNLFGIESSKSNGAGKAFVHYFKKDFIASKTKCNVLAQISIVIAEVFKLIAKDYYDWWWVHKLHEKARTLFMIWLHRKDSLPGQLPRGVIRIIIKMIID